MVNLARHYYVLASVKRSQTKVSFRREIVVVDDPIDSTAAISQLKESLATTFSCAPDAILLWAWWPLGSAAFPGKYKYAVTWLDLKEKTQMGTDIYTIQIPLDSAQGMAALFRQLPNAAPLFVQALRADKLEQFTFSRFGEFSSN